MTNDFSKGSVQKSIISQALPLMLAQLVQLLYNVVDRIYIGHLSGTDSLALTGIGLVFPITSLIAAFTNLFGTGGAPLFSIARGEKNDKKAEKILGNTFTLLLVTSALILVVCYIFKKPILYLFGASDASYVYANDYLEIYLLGTPFLMISTGLNGFINAQGFPKIGMLTTAIGAVLNLILDPLFIFAFGLGVKGAALATILSQACSAAWVISFLTSHRASLKLERRHMKLQKEIVLSILALGISPFIMASTESLVGFVLNGSLKYFGDIYVSALAIMQSAMLIVSVPLTGFAQGFVPIVSYNYGHLNKERVKSCFKIVLIFMFSFNLILILAMILFPEILATAFTNDPQLIVVVEQFMPIFLAGMTIFGLQRACQNMFVALGQAKVSVFIALLRKVFLLIPLALILPHFI